MLINLLIFFSLLIFLFILCQKITSYLYSFFFLITKSEKFSVGLLSFFLLPGTLIHELSHFLMATILRVPTGRLTIWPTIEKAGIVKTGKLELAQSDPFRRTLIGLAPLVVGLILIYFIGKLLFPTLTQLSTFNFQLSTIIFLIAVCYLLFTISSTMFSSKKDLESLIIAGPLLILIFLAMQYAGVGIQTGTDWYPVKIFLEERLVQKINLFLSDLNFYLLVSLVIDYLFFFLLAANLSLWQKLSKRTK